MKKKHHKHIQIVPGAHVPNHRIWCGHCRTMVKTCREYEGGELNKCPHINTLRHKFVAFVPGSDRRVVKTLSNNFNEALKQIAALRQQLEDGVIEVAPEKATMPSTLSPTHVATESKPELFTYIFGRYLSSLSGQGVAPHLRVVRSKGHVSDTANCGKQFCIALKKAGYDPFTFRLTDINDEVIGAFHEHIIGAGYGPTSYNRFFSMLTTFASYCEREGYPSVKRFFERVPRKTVTPRPEIITAEEFQKTLSVISHKNGVQRGIGKRKASRNHYREYLVPAFRFALYTGRRLEEILTCRFSDVHTDENGNPLFIEFTDHKVSRILRTAAGEERKVFTPASSEIISFLKEQGFGTRNPDDFVLAPEIRHNRIASMRSALTRGFSHFYTVAFPDSTREITFKTLRKTYLTNLALHMGRDVRAVSGHSSEQVLKHYISDKQLAIADSLRDFSVFGKDGALQAQRKKQNKKQQTIER